MKKKIGAFGAGQFSLGTLAGGRPGTTIFQNPGGGGAGGCRIQGPGPAAPPGYGGCPVPQLWFVKIMGEVWGNAGMHENERHLGGGPGGG